MMSLSELFFCVFIFFFHEVYASHSAGTIGRRANTPLEIETLVVADYSAFNKWYELFDTSIPHAQRVDIAKQNLTTWLGTMVHSTVQDSSWTETTKFKVNGTFMIDFRVVHPLFQVKSVELQKTTPHDHAILFTRYTLILGRNGTHLYSGNAHIGAECKAKSQSIIEDTERMDTAHTIAHELGHSLGCQHDGLHNNCTVGEGYCMEASYVRDNKNKWIFSSCSINYIRNFIDTNNRLHRNCLAKVNDNHPKPELALASQKWVGQLYSADEQCIITRGLGSYLCRDRYRGNFTGFCSMMACYDPTHDSCYREEAGDGTPCDKGSKCCQSCKHAQTTYVPVNEQCKEIIGPGSYMCRNINAYATKGYSLLCSELYCFDTSTGSNCAYTMAYDKTPCGNKKWCQDGQCVADTNAPAVSDECPMGDQENDPSVSYTNYTCAEIRLHNNNWACYSNYTKKACCKTCADIRRNVADCEYGDHHKSCFTIIASQRDSLNCYTPKNARICCETCSKYKNAANVGCEYGDKDTYCAYLIQSRSESYNCYRGNNAGICCGFCKQYFNASNVGCEYGDKSKDCATLVASRADTAICHAGHNFDVCCASCGRYYDLTNKEYKYSQSTCPYGEQIGVVHKQLSCKEIAAKRPNDCLRQDIKQKCCQSCKHAQTTSVPAEEQCKERMGPGSHMCRSTHLYATKGYSSLCSKLYCFNTSTDSSCRYAKAYDKTPCGNKKWCQDGQCVADTNAQAVSDECPMGDRENDPSVSYTNYTCAEIRLHNNNWACYSNYTKKACCKTCADIRRNVAGCEYGDEDTDCANLIQSRSESYNCYRGNNAGICCGTCKQYFNASHVGCEYGDKLNGCSSSKCSTYTTSSREGCCYSCRPSAVIVG